MYNYVKCAWSNKFTIHYFKYTLQYRKLIEHTMLMEIPLLLN